MHTLSMVANTPPSFTRHLAALRRNIPSELTPFEIGVDEAVGRFESYQASECRGMHAHSLLNDAARLMTAYLPCKWWRAHGQRGWRAEGAASQPLFVGATYSCNACALSPSHRANMAWLCAAAPPLAPSQGIPCMHHLDPGPIPLGMA